MNSTMEKFLSPWREKTAASEDMAKLASVCRGQTTPREPTNDIAAIVDRLGEADGEGQMERIEHCHNETVEAPVNVLDANDNMTGCSERPARLGAPWPQRIEERAFIPQYHSPEKLCHMASSVAPVCIAEEPYDCRYQSIYSSYPGHLGFPTTVLSSDYALQRRETPGNLPPSQSIAFHPSAPRYELDNCTQRCEEMSELLPTQPRKRPRLPEQAKAHLRRWYCASIHGPNPDKYEMQGLVRETGLKQSQIQSWLSRERKRSNKQVFKNHFGGIEYHRDGAAKINDIDRTAGKVAPAMGAIQPISVAKIHAAEHHLGHTRFPVDLPRPTPVSLSTISQAMPSSTLPLGIPLGSREVLTSLPERDSLATGPRGPEHIPSTATNLTPADMGKRDARGWSKTKTLAGVPSISHLLFRVDVWQSESLEARVQLKNEPRRVWTAEADLRRFHYS